MNKRISRWGLILSVLLLVHMPAVAEMNMRQVDQVLRNDPQNLAALFQKARLLENSGQLDDAIAVYRQIITLLPKRPEAYNNLAALYVKQGNLQEARKVLEQGMQTNPVYATMQKNLILINREMAARSYASAMVDVERPIQLAQVTLQHNDSNTVLLANADDAQLRQEQERRKAATEKARQEALARKKAEEEKRRQEELARKKAEEEKRRQELLAQKKAEEEKRRQEELARKQEEEKRRQEELARKKAEEEKRRQEELARKKAEEEKRRQEELARKQAEEEKRRQELLAQKKAEEEKRQRELLAQKQAEEQRQKEQQRQQQQIEDSVTQRVVAWAQAWSAQDTQGYIAFYVQGYQPSADMSHNAWVKQRNVRLSNPKWIKVKLENIQVKVVDANTVKVRFLQRYQSNTYQDAGYKELTLVRVNGQWLIQQERVVR